jgi:hypothetical protein
MQLDKYIRNSVKPTQSTTFIPPKRELDHRIKSGGDGSGWIKSHKTEI